ncbi:autotransporter outer membrane beta-barrel domain-containing protein [Mesorhizobium loti R88b]|uniref:Autotransporter outer membrane beta-barrel domain-containing protein n=1 Tax=Mesorhizobium loti R88b TaxID=935548 RepID=A0A6M7WEN6_RHILI|nr:autotransporter outer membrane beta-barrel domain-containing protein [Mesorhizobium loti R88b]
MKGTTQYNGNFFVSQITSGNGGDGGQAGFGGSGGLRGNSSSLAPGGLGGVALGDGSGAGMGGALFVRQGGQLIVEGNLALNGNSVAAGGAGSQAFGSGIFLQGGGNLSFKPGAGETQTISDDIDDMVGVVAQGYVPPAGTYTGNERWGVTVDGDGTLVLSGTNSFSGGVLVSKGTLSVGADASLGNPDGGITLATGTLMTTASFATDRDITLSLGGTVSQAAGTIFTVNGIVSGGGGLTKAGAGTVVLAGDNSYGGGTSLEAGTLRLDHDHALGTGSLNARDGTTIQYGLDDLSVANAIAIEGDVKFDYEQPGPIIIAVPEQAGAISGTGRLIRTGTGGLTLSHANSYEGGTIVEGGRLIASVTGALGTGDADVRGGAVLAFTGSQATPTDAGSRTITVENDGQLQFSDHSNATTTTVLNEAGGLVALKGNAAPVEVGSLSGAGDVDLDFGTMIVGGLGSDDTISGAIRDGNVPPVLLPAAQAGSLVKTGAGTLTLSGTNSYFGTTTVEEGKLVVNGSIAASSLTTVGSGAVLGGGGTIGATRVEGTIAPGNSIGTLNVKGAFTQVAGSTYAVQLDATTSDRIAVTGTADLQGGTLDVEAAPGGYSLGARYTILTTTGGLTGTYAALTGDAGPLSAFVSVIDSYDTNNAYLDVAKVRDFADAGLTPNQIATGEGLDSIAESGALFSAVAGLATDAAARGAFDQLSGEIHASAKGMLVGDSRFVRDAATNRIAAAFDDGGTTAAIPVMAYGEGGPEMVAADTDRFAVWGQAFGSWGNTDSDGNAAAFDRSTGGVLAGADTLVGGWRVGVLGGYSHSSFDADDRNSSGSSDNYHLGLYGGTNWGAIAFRTGAAYSWSSISTKRSVAFDGFTDGFSADYDAGTAQMFGELAYKADSGQFKLEPFANLAYVSVHTDGFSETGGAAALTSAGSTTDATFTTLGLRASTDFAPGGMNATARGMLGWRHAFGDTTPLSTLAFASGDAFTIAGVPIARDAAVIEAGLDFNMTANATLGLSYSGQFGGCAVDNGAKVDLNVKF